MGNFPGFSFSGVSRRRASRSLSEQELTEKEVAPAYRITLVPVKPGCSAQMADMMSKIEFSEFGFKGLRKTTVVESGETELLLVAEYDSEANAALSSSGKEPTAVQRAFGVMEEFMTGKPERHSGESVYERKFIEDAAATVPVAALSARFVPILEGKLDTAIDLIKSDLVQEKMTGIQGLRELVVVALSPTSIVGIASYESVADLEKAQETVPEILGVLKEALGGKPEGKTGRVVHVWTPEAKQEVTHDSIAEILPAEEKQEVTRDSIAKVLPREEKQSVQA